MHSVSTPTRILNNGISVPTIGIGPAAITFNDPATWHSKNDFFNLFCRAYNKFYAVPANKRRYIKAVANALKMGYRLIDYSFAYGDGNEITEAIHQAGLKREDVIITSRASNYHQMHGTVREEFFEGIKKMGVDYVDIYMFHWPVTDCFVNTYKEMERLHKEGYIKTLGVANCHQHHLQAIFDNCEIIPAIDQFEVHPLFSQKPLIEFCKSHGITVEAYTPLARNDDRLRSNKILRGLAAKYGKSISQICLRWSTQCGLIPVPRSLNKTRQYENINIFDFQMTEEEIRAIDSININSRLRYDPDNLDFTSIG